MKTRYRTQQIGILNKRTIIVLQVLKTVPHPQWWLPSKQNVTVEVWMDAVPEDLINTHWRINMNTFKRITTKVVTAVALSTAFFAHNVQAAPTDAVCVALGKWGGAVVELKQLGISEEEQMKNSVHGVKNKVARDTMVRVIRYVYIDDGKYVDARYIYLKCKIGDFD